jgi:hypothetical protein
LGLGFDHWGSEQYTAKYLEVAEKVSNLCFKFIFHCSFWHCPKKNQKGLVRLNLAPRESQNFRPLRKAMNVAHFGFPPSAGQESGQATAPFK